MKITNTSYTNEEEVDWTLFEDSKEFIVSNAAISALDSSADFVSYGTDEGGVGIFLGSRSVTIRPHSDGVTNVILAGTRIISSSLDGTIRTFDLHKKLVGLTYSWDMTSDSKHQVLGMAIKDKTSYILDCNEKLINFDPRDKGYHVLSEMDKCSDSASQISIASTRSNLVSVGRENGVYIFDMRNSKEALWWTNGQNISHAGWNANCKEYGLYDEYGPVVYDVVGGVPQTKKRLGVPRKMTKSELKGDLWCPWQSSIFFHVKRASLELANNHITAFNTAR